MSKINELCGQKRLPAASQTALFLRSETLSLDSAIDEHAAFVFKHIYQFSYPPKYSRRSDGFEVSKRLCHGISHVCRAAHYIPVFANLFEKYGSESTGLSEKDIKLLQIAMLFHDAAREDDDEDKWDQESAAFLYWYLTNTLDVNKALAKEIAEATANKDVTKHYFELIENEGDVSWSQSPSRVNKHIYQKLIHDADCLDIIRARGAFDATYLDFFAAHAVDNPAAFKDMAVLITEARSLIETQGDSFQALDTAKKNVMKVKRLID